MDAASIISPNGDRGRLASRGVSSVRPKRHSFRQQRPADLGTRIQATGYLLRHTVDMRVRVLRRLRRSWGAQVGVVLLLLLLRLLLLLLLVLLRLVVLLRRRLVLPGLLLVRRQVPHHLARWGAGASVVGKAVLLGTERRGSAGAGVLGARFACGRTARRRRVVRVRRVLLRQHDVVGARLTGDAGVREVLLLLVRCAGRDEAGVGHVHWRLLHMLVLLLVLRIPLLRRVLRRLLLLVLLWGGRRRHENWRARRARESVPLRWELDRALRHLCLGVTAAGFTGCAGRRGDGAPATPLRDVDDLGLQRCRDAVGEHSAVVQAAHDCLGALHRLHLDVRNE